MLFVSDKLTEEAALFFQVGVASLFSRSENSEGPRFSVVVQARPIPLRCAPNPPVTRRVAPPGLAVSVVLCGRARAQVHKTIVDSIPVDVVKLVGRPLTVTHEPREAMREDEPPSPVYDRVVAPAGCVSAGITAPPVPCGLARQPRVCARTNVRARPPHEYTGGGVIRPRRTRLFACGTRKSRMNGSHTGAHPRCGQWAGAGSVPLARES